MSTKASIYYHEDEHGSTHIYTDCLDQSHTVYIDRHSHGITIETQLEPAALAAVAKHGQQIIDHHRESAMKTDAEIEASVAADVDERIAEAKAGSKWAILRGVADYGDVDAPREVQIKRGIARRQQSREISRQYMAQCEKAATPRGEEGR